MLFVRRLTLLSLHHDVHIIAKHVPDASNDIADVLSRQQWSCFRRLALWVDISPGSTPNLASLIFPSSSGSLFLDHNRRCSQNHVLPCDFSNNKYLQQGVQWLWRSALAPSNHNAYSTGLRVFHQFLSFNQVHRPIRPCTNERTLQKFISYCSDSLRTRTSSIRGYLSAIRYYCFTFDHPDPLRHSNGQFKLSLRNLLNAREEAEPRPRSRC